MTKPLDTPEGGAVTVDKTALSEQTLTAAENPMPAQGEARDLPAELSSRISGLPKRSSILALADLAPYHSSAASAYWSHLERLAGSASITERAFVLEITDTIAQQDPKAALAIADKTLTPMPGGRNDDAADDLPANSALLLASSQLFNLLFHLSWSEYDAIAPILARMLDTGHRDSQNIRPDELEAVSDQAARNAVMVTLVAACQHSGALELLNALDVQSRIRRGGTAAAMAHLVPMAFAPDEVLGLLVDLFDDPDDEVAREAGMALFNVPDGNDQVARRLLTAAGAARTFELASGPVVRCLERFGGHLPETVLTITKRFFDVYGHEASDIRTASVYDATVLSKLVMSTYTHAAHLKNHPICTQALDLIDQGILSGTWGIEEHMALLDR